MVIRTFLLFTCIILQTQPVSAQETAENVIKQAIKAAGYPTDKKAYHQTWKEQGKLSLGGVTLPYDAKWYYEPASKFRFEMKAEFQGQKMDVLFIHNGNKAKETMNGNHQMLQGEKLEESNYSAYVFWVNSLMPLVEEKGFTLKHLGDKEFAGKPVTSVQVSREGYRDMTLHFDRKTHLLAGCSDRVKDEAQGWKEVPQETEYFDYVKQPNGEMMFTGMRVKRNGQLLLESKLSDNKRIDGFKPELFKID
ncbi:MAG TPA: hypothetical protein PLN21_20560 [Gemmatales bacterium]|nr:hypothetical protein [Gemmatales bacterium]